MSLRHPLLRIVLVSFPVGLVSTLSWFGVFTFVNAYLKHKLGYDNEAWTAATLWYTGSMFVWPFLCSEISSWLGRRWTVLCGLALAAILFYGFSVFQQHIAICVMLSLMALAVVIISTVFLPMVAEAGGERPGRALVTYNFVNNFIGACALIGGSYLAEYFGYHLTFLILAMACGISAVLYVLLTVNFGGAQPVKTVSLRSLSRRDLVLLLTGPYLIIVLCGMSMEAFNYHTMNQLWPNLARDFHDMTETAIGSMVALGRLPALLTLFIMGQIIDRVNVVRTYGFSFLYVAACVFSMSLLPTDDALKMGYIAYFLGVGGIWGSNSPAVNAAVPPRLRDCAFAVMMVPAQLAVFLVGIFHNRLLAAGQTLPDVFRWCSLIAFFGGGLVLVIYSFTRQARRPVEHAEAPVAETA